MEQHPVRLVLSDDLRRSRLTVFFRLLLAIPHLIWFLLWTVAAVVAAIANWFATLAVGRPPEALHRFLAAYLRYATHLGGYLYLAANPFPGFTGEPGSYPVDLEIDPPAPQSRWKTAFRLVLAVPALLFLAALDGRPGGGSAQGDDESTSAVVGFTGVTGIAAFLAWFVCLARAQAPLGLRNVLAYALRYSAQAGAYLLLLTDRYPNSDPKLPADAGAPPAHPIGLEVSDDLARSRLTVFFRLLLALPHLVWLALWGVAAFFVVIVVWFATLVTGRPPAGLRRFLAGYLRYQVHVLAYLFVLANPFPGFVGAPGYPVDARIDPPEGQNRWVTGFRLPLAVPALFLAAGLNGVMAVAAFLGWFASLALGRMPEGLRNAGTFALRYSTQATGYVLLVTDRYPFGGPPVEEEPVADEALSAGAPA